MKRQKIGIARDDHIRATGDRRFKKLVVFRVSAGANTFLHSSHHGKRTKESSDLFPTIEGDEAVELGREKH